MQEPTRKMDKAVMAVSGALMLLGIVVLGIVEILAGQPYNPVPLTNEAGEVIATPAIDPVLRTGIVILGLVILLGWQAYKVVATKTEDAATQQVEAPAN